MSVPVLPLGEVADFTNGVAFKSTDWGGSGARIIRIQNLTDPSKPYNRTERAVPEKVRVHPGDLLVSWSATLGVFEWTGPDVGVLNQHIFRVQPDPERVDKQYLRYAIDHTLRQAERHLHGATMKHINKGDLLASRILAPAVPEQRRIAAVLSRIDALRAKRRRAVALLDELARSLFLDMFGDPVTNPRGLTRMPLTEACQCHSGGTPPKADAANWNGGLPWFTAKDLKSTDLFASQVTISPDVPDRTTLRLLPEDTVVLVVRGMVLAHSFPVSVLRVGATVNQDLKALLPRVDLDAQFLAYCLRVQKEHALRQVSQAAHGTTRLDAEGLARIHVLLPPGEQQREFARRIAGIDGLRRTHRSQLAALDDLFSSVQHRTFGGRNAA